MKLNLGCGAKIAEGWLNVDYAMGARLARLPLFNRLNKTFKFFDLDWNDEIYIHDLTKKFPWADNSINVVYSSHTLEHFTKIDGRKFLSECHRVLTIDGIIRIVVPDLRYYIDEYLSCRIQADEFLEKLGVLYGGCNGKIKHKLAKFVQYPHKCMYDDLRLLELLNEAGFHSESRLPFDSDIDDINLIELESRVKNSVIVEGRKK